MWAVCRVRATAAARMALCPVLGLRLRRVGLARRFDTALASFEVAVSHTHARTAGVRRHTRGNYNPGHTAAACVCVRRTGTDDPAGRAGRPPAGGMPGMRMRHGRMAELPQMPAGAAGH